MTRLIDADALNYIRVRIYHNDGTVGGYNAVVPSSEIRHAPTVDAIPVDFIEKEAEKMQNSKNPAIRMNSVILSALIRDWREQQNETCSR